VRSERKKVRNKRKERKQNTPAQTQLRPKRKNMRQLPYVCCVASVASRTLRAWRWNETPFNGKSKKLKWIGGDQAVLGSTPARVHVVRPSTWMGDCLWTSKPVSVGLGL